MSRDDGNQVLAQIASGTRGGSCLTNLQAVGGRVSVQQGYTWVDTGHPGVSQLYWNHTQFEEVVVKGNSKVKGAVFGACSGDYEAVVRSGSGSKR